MFQRGQNVQDEVKVGQVVVVAKRSIFSVTFYTKSIFFNLNMTCQNPTTHFPNFHVEYFGKTHI